MSSDARKILGKRIKAAREETGLSQEQVAKQLGIPRSAVSQMESGNRRVEAIELGRMAKLYSKTLAFFSIENEGTDSLAVLHRAVKELSDTDREQVLHFAEFLRSKIDSEGQP